LENENAIHIIEKNLDKINWILLSTNPKAIHILEKNQDKIKWNYLSENPAIFVLDKDAMKQQIMNFGKKSNNDFGFAEELIATALHPKHLKRNLELYNYDILIEEYID
jgi:hypothetical protein